MGRSKRGQIRGEIWGYDPGGNGRHGVARLAVVNSHAVNLEAKIEKTASNALAWFAKHEISELLGVGVDTLTALSGEESGDRPADRWLRMHYPDAENSVLRPNGLFGAMCLNGLWLILQLRKKRPALLVSETHPKVLFFALANRRYKDVGQTEKIQMLGDWLRIPPKRTWVQADENAWDAAASTLPVLKFLTARWKDDLHNLGDPKEKDCIHPAGKTNYFWPPLNGRRGR